MSQSVTFQQPQVFQQQQQDEYQKQKSQEQFYQQHQQEQSNRQLNSSRNSYQRAPLTQSAVYDTKFQDDERYYQEPCAYQNTHSAHLAHHEIINRQRDIEKQFNYSGSRLRSPHHNPMNKIKQRLQNNLKLDSVYNSHTENYTGTPVNRTAKNSSERLMVYPQPFGSGVYTNQLTLKTSLSKTGFDFNTQIGRIKRVAKSSIGMRQPLQTDSTLGTLMQDKKTQEKLREKLYFDERTKTVPKSTIKNGIIEDIVSEGEIFANNKQLMSSVYSLKRLNLLKQHESHVNRFKGVGKFPFVFNDYHSKSTNNGYSRQEKGGFFFTK